MTTANSYPNSQDTVQNLTAHSDGAVTATPAKARFASAENAWNVFQKCMRDDDPAAVKRAKVQGLIDGNPPYNPATLEAMGQSWRANVNYREAESIRDSNASAYWSLVTDVPNMTQIKVRKQKDQQTWEMDDWGQIIAEEYNDIMFEWDDFYFNFMLHVGEMLTFGMGPLIWTDRFNWQSKAIQHSSVLIPPRTKSTIGSVSVFFVRDTISLHKLFENIEDPEVASTLGWNVEQVKKVIIDRYAKGRQLDSEKYSVSPWESLQQMFKNNDVWQDFDDIDELKIVHCFAQEVSGDRKISHYIIPEVEAIKDFMFKDEGRYDDMSQVFDPFIFNIGDGFMRSIKGIGQRMYQAIELSNRLINTTFDASMLGSSLICSGSNKQDMRLLRIGPITRLPEGVTPIQQSFAPNITGSIQARSMLQGILANTHGIQPPVNNDAPRRTMGEAMLMETKEAKLLNFQISQYYTHLDRFHRETIRRLLSSNYPAGHAGDKERKLFIQRCLDRGVPREILDFKKLKIKSTRAVGSGSATVRDMKTKEILELSALFDERGKKNAVRDRVAAITGYDGADRYAPIADRNQIVTSEHTMATLENNDLADGKPVPVGVDQPHGIHLMVHVPQVMEFVQKIMEAMQNGQDINPEAVMPYLGTAHAHITEHVQMYSIDPRSKAVVKQYVGILKMIEGLTKEMESSQKDIDQERAKANQEAQATLQEAQLATQSDELKVKLAQVQADFQVRLQDATNKARIKEMTAKHNMMIKEMKFNQEQQQKQQEGVLEA